MQNVGGGGGGGNKVYYGQLENRELHFAKGYISGTFFLQLLTFLFPFFNAQDDRWGTSEVRSISV